MMPSNLHAYRRIVRALTALTIALTLLLGAAFAVQAVPSSTVAARKAPARAIATTPQAPATPTPRAAPRATVAATKAALARATRIARVRAERRRRATLLRWRQGKFLWPITGMVTSPMGKRRSPITRKKEFHRGTDILCDKGDPITASRGGRVLMAGKIKIYGRIVVIRHVGGWTTLYAHMHRLKTAPGRTVAQGQVIGTCGASGWATGPHLHFEIRGKSGRHYDPVDKMWPRRPRG